MDVVTVGENNRKEIGSSIKKWRGKVILATNRFLKLLTVELDGFNAGRVREAWVIAVER